MFSLAAVMFAQPGKSCPANTAAQAAIVTNR
jgi:hypothetical protein